MRPRYYLASERNINLKVGDWVVALNCKPDRPVYNDGYDERPTPRQQRFEASGLPQVIVGISLPFIAVKGVGEDRSMGVFDLRFIEVRKAEAGYVQAFKDDWNSKLERYKKWKKKHRKKRVGRKTAK